MSQVHDLTPRLAQYLDVHMVAPLLDFLRETELYDAKLLTRQKLKALMKTNLIDLVMEEYAGHGDDEALQKEYESLKPELLQRRVELFEKIDHEPDRVKTVAEYFAKSLNPEDIKAGSVPLESLIAAGITLEDLEEYARFGKFKYECGMYEEAEAMLSNYLSVVQASSPAVIGARWGRLACRILGSKWDAALTDLLALKELIESRATLTSSDQLKQRAWLIHWGLFVYINQRDGVDSLADFLSEKVYLQTIENFCPWLLRYYVAFVLMSPRRKALLKDVIVEVQTMSHLYNDPLLRFVASLYERFDLNEAQSQLVACRTVLKNDFFLQIFAERFVQEARVLICDVYCSLHKSVGLAQLASRLQLPEEDTEKWLAGMVLQATSGTLADAKIDSATQQVVMSAPSRNAYQLMIERTRDMKARTTQLASQLSVLAQDQAVFVKCKQ